MYTADDVLPGVELTPLILRPNLYSGEAYSTFGWHVRDQNLFSISHNHFFLLQSTGMPPTFGKKIENLAADYVKDKIESCASKPFGFE